jgi:hypothetical protein
VDHSYKREGAAIGKHSAHTGGGADHFDPNYRKPGEIVNTAPLDGMELGYQYVRELADKRGVEIINISRTSALTAFALGTVEDAVAAIGAHGDAATVSA